MSVPKIWVNDKIFIDGAAPTREMMALTLVGMMEQALDPQARGGRFRIQRTTGGTPYDLSIQE